LERVFEHFSVLAIPPIKNRFDWRGLEKPAEAAFFKPMKSEEVIELLNSRFLVATRAKLKGAAIQSK
jgi:hypothetical protein